MLKTHLYILKHTIFVLFTSSMPSFSYNQIQQALGAKVQQELHCRPELKVRLFKKKTNNEFHNQIWGMTVAKTLVTDLHISHTGIHSAQNGQHKGRRLPCTALTLSNEITRPVM